MTGFYQDAPQLGNQFDDDRLLRSYLQRMMQPDERQGVESDLSRFADRLLGDIADMAADAEAHPPQLIQFDPWGRRIDHIELARGWQELETVSAEEGLVAIGYERRLGPLSRIHQFAKLYLFNPSSAVFSCPLAMADGAARLLEVLGDDDLRKNAFARLTTRDPAQFWTSGQWMTERTGGSDVGISETIARADGDIHRLYGCKWFTSSTTSQMAMTLARIEPPGGEATPGSRGLSLFYVETRDADGQLNNMVINRLKDKLGSKALPTAELELQGTVARLVGTPGRGVANITTLVNVTRLYNAVSAVSLMRRGLALARDYARRRVAFGNPLAEQPLHVETLANLEVDFTGCFLLAFRGIELLGREECGVATPEESAVLRLLTPIAKLYTGKRCVAFASEILESFGGAGYVEDTGLPKLLRDGQVLSIWEGTTNVLSLDCLRAIDKEAALPPLLDDIRKRVAATTLAELQPCVQRIGDALEQIEKYLPTVLSAGREAIEAGARRFAFALARTYAASLLIEHAQWVSQQQGDARGCAIARRWCRDDLAQLNVFDAGYLQESHALAMDEPLDNVETKDKVAPKKSGELV